MKDALHFVLPGGTGNLGRDLRSALLARGHRVTTLTRGAEDQAAEPSTGTHARMAPGTASSTAQMWW